MDKKTNSLKSNKTVKNIITSIFVLTLLFLTSCKSDDPVETPQESATVTLDCATSVASGETLTLENLNNGVDYIINCTYVVDGDLIIKPGVTIQFGTDAGIRVDSSGSLQVLGLEDNQIVFTGEDKTAGAWKGLFIDSNDTKNRIEHAKIEYAGGDSFNSNGDKGGVIVYADGYLNMNNTTITNSEAFGFNANYNGSKLTLENNTITACNIPMRIKPEYAGIIDGGTYTGNTTDVIEVYSYTSTIAIHAVWTDLGVPYRITDYLEVSPEGKLTINPGVELEFGLNAQLFINESASGPKPSLIAVGTADNPIIFTGINKVSGAWKGIYFDSPSPLNEIAYATIEYASTPQRQGAVETWFGTVLNIHDVNFKHIQRCSLHIYHNGTHAITYSNLFHTDVSNTICEN